MSPFTVPSSVNTRVGPVASAGANGCVEEFTPCRTTRDICAVLPEIVSVMDIVPRVVFGTQFPVPLRTFIVKVTRSPSPPRGFGHS